MLLENKIALVTGSTHNIGLGIARAFARKSCRAFAA
jgi:NAD(P)-dependent dehydrogenase (short-subunit alcohol dehydrogenase family)